ncbi:hypothetical protein ACFLRB_04145, partial [Acidobacteriota bacterium]
MKKIYIYLMCSALFFIGFHCSKAPAEEVEPVVLKTGPSQVTIGWLSQKAYRGSVFYRLAGTEGKPSAAVESPGETRQHEVIVTGLKPGTHYTYWIGEVGEQFRFRTQPPVNKPFTFMMAVGDLTGEVGQAVQAEVFDFLVSLTPVKKTGQYAGIRATIPVFDPAGILAIAGETPGQSETKPPGLTWKLDWGALRLVFMDNLDKLAGLLDTPAPHTFGILTYPGVLDAYKPSGKVDLDSTRASNLHAALMIHNRKNPTRPASFVFVLGTKDDKLEVDDIQYVGIPVEVTEGTAGIGKAIRVDVDVENIRAVFLDTREEIVLRMPPLKGRRTCLECRRLAAKGAYQTSIKAYKEFTETNAGHYQIDDAYFAIAEIYDEKLFLFHEALQWYQRLIDEYPAGSLTPLARQRTTFLTQYSTHELKLLRRFEQIRKVEFSRKKDQEEELVKLLEEVETTIKENPGSKLAPVMQHWVANRYRQFSMDKALTAYRILKEKYPGSVEAKEAAIEIGETYYNAGLYKEALTAYRKALQELPGSAKTINSQIKRTKRNIRRDVLAILFWAFLLLLTAVVILIKPRGFDFSKIGRYILVFIILFILLSFAAWLIHEQFPSTAKWVLFALLFSFNAVLSSLISTNFVAKALSSCGRGLRIIIGSLIGIVFFATGFYQ